MKFELYRESPAGHMVAHLGKPPGDWRWRLRARNGKIVAEGGEGYERAHDMVRTVRKYVANTLPAQHALAKACTKAGLTTTGHQAKTRSAA